MSSAPLTPFADSGGLVHFFDRRFPEKGTVSRRPEDLFSESEFHARYDCRGGRLETPRRLAREVPDEAVLGVTEKITAAVRAKKPPGLVPSEKETWDRYLFSHLANLRDDLVPFFEKNFPERISQVAEKARSELPVWNDEVRLVFQEQVEKAEEQLKEKFPFCLVKSDGEVLRMLESRGLCIAAIPGPRKSFVLGNKPVSSPTRFYSYEDAELAFWLPIARDVAVTPYFSRGEEKTVEFREASRIRGFNQNTFSQSSIIIGRSPELVRSLAAAR